jgi:hypothetical protein
MSEEQTKKTANEIMIENAKEIAQQMRTQLEEFANGETFTMEGGSITFIDGIRVGTGEAHFTYPEPNGRDEPVPYESPLEAGDVVEDALDAEAIGTMAPEPQDRLDVERHIESCATCQRDYFKLCAHCLELKVCTEVPVKLRQTEVRGLYAKDQADELVYFARLPLCRECKRDSECDRGLVLEE